MENKSSVELLTAEEVQEIVTPSSREVRTQMPHRRSPVLTEEDRFTTRNTGTTKTSNTLLLLGLLLYQEAT